MEDFCFEDVKEIEEGEMCLFWNKTKQQNHHVFEKNEHMQSKCITVNEVTKSFS